MAAHPADLAGRNSLAASQPHLAIGLHIHHIRDQPGYVSNLLTEGLREDAVRQSRTLALPLSETLSASAFGVGVVIGGSKGGVARRVDRSVLRTSEPDLTLSRKGPHGREFQGTAFPNPTFLYDGRAALEGMVIVDSAARRPTVEHGKIIKQVIRLIAHIAYKRLDSPLISVQSPAHVPTRARSESHSTGGEDEWSYSSDLAVRFSIASGELTSAERTGAMQELMDYCESHGLGLSLLDPRPAHRSGNWFTIIAPKPQRTDHHDSLLHAVYPMTFVGPARVGSTAAIIRQFDEIDEVPIVSCSITSLSDLAFISLQIGLDRPRYSGIVGDANARSALRDLDQSKATQAISAVLDRLSYRGLVTGPAKTAMQDRAGDYAVCHGPLLRMNPGISSHTRPIWFSLEGRASRNGLATSIPAMYEALKIVLGPARDRLGEKLPDGQSVVIPNLEYLIARETVSGALRARGKLGMTDTVVEALLPGYANNDRAGMISNALEDEWSARLSSSQLSWAGLSVAWRESWLGHWTGGFRVPMPD
jgi:hypothetical protein